MFVQYFLYVSIYIGNHLACHIKSNYFMFSLIKELDKKNENKEVAVNDFLPASAAYEAIKHSM